MNFDHNFLHIGTADIRPLKRLVLDLSPGD